eukprot:gene19824-21764_t
MGNSNYDVAHREGGDSRRVRKSRLFIFVVLFVILLVATGLLSGLLSAKYERDKIAARRGTACEQQKEKRDNAANVQTAPYGSWKSPLTSKVVSSSSIAFQDLRVDPTDPESVYWSELRPDQGGIKVIFSFKTGDQQPTQWTPQTMSCNSRVHEYGGGAFIVYNKVVYFINQKDQAIYSQSSPSAQPSQVTREDADARYADCDYHKWSQKLICVKEDHSGVKRGTKKEADNTIVIVDIATRAEKTLVYGTDFYASPRVSADGSKLIWMQWAHPNMPWDDTNIYTANFNFDHSELDKGSLKKVIGRSGLNVMSPNWDVDGSYLYISDETNWWNIYRQSGDGKKNLFEKDMDFGQPQWKLGGNLFSVNSKGDIVFIYDKTPAIIDRNTGEVEKLPSDNRHANDVLFSPTGKYVYFLGYSPVAPAAILRIEIAQKSASVVRLSSSLPVDSGYLTEPEKMSFPTDSGKSVAYGYLYLPKNKDFKAPEGTKPPLLIMAHGGPTASADLALDFEKQYYTSRGFAILDVDYRGSTGYGRAYRTSLYRNWGLYDMEDCANGASYLAYQMKVVDPAKLAITGGSAGGYTTLTSLTFTDVFAAGSSHYGISDVLVLINETHKFESRYIDYLLAPGEEGRNLAVARSPIYHLDKLKKPIVFFQGELDKVVPKNQAEKMFEAIKAKGLPCAFILFQGEYHGFAKAENKQKALDGEFYFFSKLLKFEAADKDIEIPIENLPSN